MATNHGKILKNDPVFLRTIQVLPVGVKQIGMEVAQHCGLDVGGNGDVIFHGVQSPEHQVKYAHCIPV